MPSLSCLPSFRTRFLGVIERLGNIALALLSIKRSLESSPLEVF